MTTNKTISRGFRHSLAIAGAALAAIEKVAPNRVWRPPLPRCCHLCAGRQALPLAEHLRALPAQLRKRRSML